MNTNSGLSTVNESTFSSDEPDELKNIIEAAIMLSEDPLTIDRILGMFTDATKPERATIKELLLELEQDYARRGFELRCIDKGYRLQTREEYSPWLARLSAGRTPRYSRAMLETLAIIAYRQPVTRGEIEEIRGVAVSTDIIRNLQDREWVRQVGVRDVPGKPALFATTKSFLEYFSLESLSQLPTLQDIRDMDTIAAELNMKLPLEEKVAKEIDEGIDEDIDEENKQQNSPQGELLEKPDADEPDSEAVDNSSESEESSNAQIADHDADKAD